MIDLKLLGNRIRELRQRKGLTQSEFADILSVSFQAVSNWERGITPPDLENLMRIGSCFGILVDTLLSPIGENLYLGVDGGGTKTKFVVVTADGRVVKHTTKSGSNPNDIGFSAVKALITEAIQELLIEFPSIKGIFFGIAGMDSGTYASELTAVLKRQYPQIAIRMENDAYNLFGLEDTADIVVISGTGSVVFHKDNGTCRRLGGWGYLFNDAGSAFDIAKDAICHALEEEDLLEVPSCLSRLLLQKMNTGTVWEHIDTLYKGGKPYIAGFASVVFDAYQKNDSAAIEIIDRNAKKLAKLINVAAQRCSPNAVAVASGGLFEHYPDIMTHHIGQYSNVRLVISKMSPVYGACKNACAIAGCQVSDSFFETFSKTYEDPNT